MMFRPTGLMIALVLLMGSSAMAQTSRHYVSGYPLPPGQAGKWAGAMGRGNTSPDQHIKLIAPGNAQVTVFTPAGEELTSKGSIQVQVAVGPVYRFRMSGFQQAPEFEIYPSIELIDRLHPPAELAAKFPIPVELTQADIEYVRSGRMVTRVIYLEQPQLADPTRSASQTTTEMIADPRELMAAADYRGRPMAILRIGGRLPDARELNSPLKRSLGPVAGPIPPAK